MEKFSKPTAAAVEHYNSNKNVTKNILLQITKSKKMIKNKATDAHNISYAKCRSI